MKVEQDVYWSDAHPTELQEARMNEITDACYETYCWAIDALAAGKYDINEATLYDVLDHQMKPDWIESRPKKVCPWTTMRYTIRDACHNWLDETVLREKDPNYLVEYLKQKHKNCLYVPHTRMKITDTVQIERVCRIKIDPVEIPTAIHLVIIHRDGTRWRAEIRAAKKREEKPVE